jgi:hypothetical protein
MLFSQYWHHFAGAGKVIKSIKNAGFETNLDGETGN